MSHAEQWTAWAAYYRFAHNLSLVPICAGDSKKPCVKWLEFQSRWPTIDDILSWPKENLAVVTGSISNLCIVDCESREDAEWFYRTKGQSPVIVKTTRGFHFYFRWPGQRVMNAQKVEGRYDVRGDSGFALLPPSANRSWVKPLIPTSELPVFNMAWRPETTPGRPPGLVSDAVAYIAKITATSGSGGSNDTYRAACILQESGLNQGEALLALQEWNRTNASPPWSDRELLHKINQAFA